MKKLIHAILSLLKTIAIFCLWFLLTALITISLSKLEKEYYAPTDTPNERFMVNGQRWQDFKTNPKPIITEPYGDCMENCLKILDNGNYLYIRLPAKLGFPFTLSLSKGGGKPLWFDKLTTNGKPNMVHFEFNLLYIK